MKVFSRDGVVRERKRERQRKRRVRRVRERVKVFYEVQSDKREGKRSREGRGKR